MHMFTALKQLSWSQGGAELAARKGAGMEPDELISKREAIQEVRNMLDIDGFRDGYAVNRAAVIAILDSMHGKRERDLNVWEDDCK